MINFHKEIKINKETKSTINNSTILIVAEKLFQNDKLIELLYQHNIYFIKRYFSFGEDIIIDEKTCIIFYNLSTLLSKTNPFNAVQNLVEYLLKLSIRYELCWLIFENYNQRFIL